MGTADFEEMDCEKYFGHKGTKTQRKRIERIKHRVQGSPQRARRSQRDHSSGTKTEGRSWKSKLVNWFDWLSKLSKGLEVMYEVRCMASNENYRKCLCNEVEIFGRM